MNRKAADPESLRGLERLGETRLADRRRLLRELDRLRARRRGDPRRDYGATALGAAIDASAAEVRRLRSLPLRTDCDPALPIAAHRETILGALERHPVVIVCGATGSGKTTQLPKICLAAGRGALGLIGHTQPRRIAARALAARIASELGTAIGGAVGYQVRFADRTGPDCRVKLMTDGILLKELEHDPELRRYDTLIIDEAHERTLNIDLLLGLARRLTARRPELRVIVTSATIDPDKFSRFFDAAPVIEVSGRGYPIEVRYRPLLAEDADAAELSLPEGIVAAVRELAAEPGDGPGDILVFLPGEKHIREAADALAQAAPAGTEVLPLFARLTAREQERIFAPHAGRRVVLATNVAETSLTVPGIRYVIDSGLARVSRYNVRGKVQRLPIERVSQASADQRKGRCGRERDGICIRLYTEQDFLQREPFTPPEVLRTNLASVILQLAARDLGEPETFPFLDPPDSRLVNDGIRLLQELRAMDAERRITSLGRQVASLPVDPRLARMLIAASHHACVTEMLVIASFLETQDPRERPADVQRQADERHAAFADSRSDFVSALNLWRAWQEQSAALGGSALRRWCRERYLSFVRMREWQELHAQLADAVAELGLAANTAPASYAGLHRAILTGFLGSIGRLQEKRDYAGPRGIRFRVAPGTPLAARPPPWLVAASLVETTQLYARTVALVQPPWIESAAAHLVRRSYSEAHWVAARGCVAAEETVTLHGLTLAAGRLVNFAPIDPASAREIFAREALVEGRIGIRAPFLEANRTLRAEVEALEAKIRRRDVLVDDAAQVEFYLARIPARIDTLSAFERWRAETERREPRQLFMERADLMRREAPAANPLDFPDTFAVGESRLPLEYRFEPGAAGDGVTLIAPLALVDSLDEQQLAWLVPGLRLEKLTALLRALPKALRKRFVPVPEHAVLALAEAARAARGGLPPLHDWLSHWIARHAGTTFTAAELAALPLPDHLRLNLRVLDAEGHVAAEGRELGAIRARLRIPGPAAGSLAAAGRGRPAPARVVPHREWDFGDLPASVAVETARLKLVQYPAIEDLGTGVRIVELPSALDAAAVSRAGLGRLASCALPQLARHVRRGFAEDRELVLRAHALEVPGGLPDALTDRTFRECFFPAHQPVPRTRVDFLARIEERRPHLDATAKALAELLRRILTDARDIREQLDRLGAPAFSAARAEVQAQLDALLQPRFLDSIADAWLSQYPRYFAAMRRRLERLRGNVERDAALAAQARPFADALAALEAQTSARAARPETERLRWMIEEYRVSLHAQELGTTTRVSDKRLGEQLAAARAEARA